MIHSIAYGTRRAHSVDHEDDNWQRVVLASASLKLSQKAGQYQLTATWTPGAGDDAKWTGSAAAATFKLQSK